MDFIESLGKQISEITVYDVKSALDKAKNIVMNYTEMESKVREATNDDPWGASSTLMTEIAQATFNFQLFNEIMPVIYKRFTEKEARDWRQIYKALTLLEYLVKHGSERVVDDARSHLSMIKMLRNFHYIDEKGKDQGINVRNRSKELSELLNDLDRVRMERRKAKSNKNKYTGQGNDGGSSFGGGPSFTSSSGSRYGGFGSDAYYANQSSSNFADHANPVSDFARTGGSTSTRRDSFEEYDAGDDDDRAGAPSSSRGGRSAHSSVPAPIKKDTPVTTQPKKEINLFDFDDDEPVVASAPAPAATTTLAQSSNFDDDFDDFQSAAPAAASPPPAQKAPAASANFFDMMGGSSSTPSFTSPPLQSQAQQPKLQTSQNMLAGPNYSGVGLFSNNTSNNGVARPSLGAHSASASSLPAAAAAKPATKSSAFDFDDLFAASGAKSSTASKATGTNSMASLAAQKQSSQLWGSTASGNSSSHSKANDDLLF